MTGRFGIAKAYRPDIDGLRGIAIASVLAFHAFPAAIPGGFVGVDVFFVISGFLISRLIMEELDTGSFSYARFYARRARRIFPALVAVLIACLLAAWAVLLPDEWTMFGRNLAAAAAFISNLMLMRTSSYFDWESHNNALLHLWSLGIEEQFYLVWPVFLGVLWRLRRSIRPAVIVTLVVISFGLNVALVGRYPVYTFYFPGTRFWELAIGSLLAWVDYRKSSIAAPWFRVSGGACGLALCLLAPILIQDGAEFPGWNALMPTAGAALVIAAGANSPVNRRLLSSPPLLFLGLISYPLYLWHWPLLFFGTVIGVNARSTPLRVTCLAASVILAFLTTRFIENPIRSAPTRSNRLKIITAAVVLLALLGAAVWSGIFANRIRGPAVTMLLTATRDWNYPFGDNFGRRSGFVRHTLPGDLDTSAILFMGDSHMEHYWSRIEHVSSTGGVPELRFVTNGGCAPFRTARGYRSGACADFVDFAFHEAADPRVGSVVISAAWSLYPVDQRTLQLLTRDISGLVTEGKRVWVILPSPVSESLNPRSLISRTSNTVERRRELPLDELLAEIGPIRAAVQNAAAAGGATVIDPLEWFCSDRTCPATAADGRPLYKDSSHLRPFYVLERARFIDQVIHSSR